MLFNTYVSSVKNTTHHGIVPMRFCRTIDTLCEHSFRHFTLCANNLYVLCKPRLPYVQTSFPLCANIVYPMCKHSLPYVQTPIALCANTY